MTDETALAALTREYGGDWGLDHTKRLLHLVEALGAGMDFDKEALTIAAYLHDWGGYQPFAQPGVDHAERSRQVAEEFLAEQNYPEEKRALVLECIACHHGGPGGRSIESRLLADADALDLLGVVGVCRIFAMNSRDIRAGHAAVKMWREKCIAALTLDQSRELAAKRLAETDQLLKSFEEETFGIF